VHCTAALVVFVPTFNGRVAILPQHNHNQSHYKHYQNRRGSKLWCRLSNFGPNQLLRNSFIFRPHPSLATHRQTARQRCRRPWSSYLPPIYSFLQGIFWKACAIGEFSYSILVIQQQRIFMCWPTANIRPNIIAKYSADNDKNRQIVISDKSLYLPRA
jgi:hypothetical protein